jgi:periplasmic protein TonB
MAICRDMHKLDLVSRPRADKGRKHHRFAYLASVTLHGFALLAVIALACLYGQLPLPRSGSAAGSTSISLEKMLVVAPPAEPPPAPPKVVDMPKISMAPVDPGFGPMRAEIGVPVLLAQPTKSTKPTETMQAKPRTAAHGTAQRETKAAATAVSSYAPGQNFMPHPPYPSEAHDRGEMGTVVLMVYFSPKGNVDQVEVSQSSGSSILDSETRSFIRMRWHCPEFAGQIKTVPVQYTLQEL